MTREITAVFSDLHANARALRAAIAHAERLGFDRAVVLGDLLTYGVDQDEVLDLVADLVANHGAAVIVGNHDQLYFDLAAGERAYYNTLPPWLRETVDRTFERLDAQAFQARFRWQQSSASGPWLLSHANPWGAADWRYLYTAADAARAAGTLRANAHVGGVFGHTHRRHALAFGLDLSEAPRDLGDAWEVDEREGLTLVVNPGSIGQPRHSDCRSTYLRLTREGDRARGALLAVDYDVAAHVRALRAASFTEATRDKLCRFFEASGSAAPRS